MCPVCDRLVQKRFIARIPVMPLYHRLPKEGHPGSDTGRLKQQYQTQVKQWLVIDPAHDAPTTSTMCSRKTIGPSDHHNLPPVRDSINKPSLCSSPDASSLENEESSVSDSTTELE